MNIGLIGHGKMGHLLEKIAENRGHLITAIIDPNSKHATEKTFSQKSRADIFLDFSSPESALKNIHTACAHKKNLIMGTTGWTEKIEEVKAIVSKSGIGFLWASNFSPAVQMFLRTARNAAQIANAFPECDTAVWEAHHRHKVDAPSGTALSLGEILLEELDDKTRLLLDRPTDAIQKNELHIATIRGGEIPGTHAALFDFPAETIELKCTSRSREGFALGAIIAAEWMTGKNGFFRFDDIFEDIVGGKK